MLAEAEVLDWRQRAGDRFSLSTGLAIKWRGNSALPAHLRNIDHAGCRVTCLDFLAIGSHVWLTFSGLRPVQAKVVWKLGADTGLAFLDDLSPDQFYEIRKDAEAA